MRGVNIIITGAKLRSVFTSTFRGRRHNLNSVSLDYIISLHSYIFGYIVVNMPISVLPPESIIAILSYLRAVDLANTYATNKSLFPALHISEAVSYQISHVYMYPMIMSPSKTDSSVAESKDSYRSEHLFIVEVKSILLSLTSPQPNNGKGYWVSSSWIANARKYYESIVLPEISKSKKIVSKKAMKIRQRRGSDALPPWPAINAEITCIHGGLALSRGSKAKRRIVDFKSWKLIRQFYPQGFEFKCPKTSECSVCTAEAEDAKSLAQELKDVVQMSSRIDRLPDTLQSLYARKSGVPAHLVAQRVAMFNEFEVFDENSRRSRGESFADSIDSTNSFSPPGDEIMAMYAAMYLDSAATSTTTHTAYPSFSTTAYAASSSSSGPGSAVPLVPGLYTILPRAWLKAWRQYIKDPTISILEPLDSTCLLCPTHNRLVIPPHLDEYLRGFRRHLLSGLGSYPGLKVELLSMDEWDALHVTMHATLSEFVISFSNDGENIVYSIDPCSSCHPIYYDPRNIRDPTKNRSNPQPIRPSLG
jgi:hypothetical protein